MPISIIIVIFCLALIGNSLTGNWFEFFAYAQPSTEKRETEKAGKEKIRSVKWLDIGVRFDKNHNKFNTMCCPQERNAILPIIKKEYPDYKDIYGITHILKEEDIYMTTFDLNKDDIKDIVAIIDTWDCGSAGCPVRVYIVEKDGKYKDVFRDEDAKGWAIGVIISRDKHSHYYDIVLGSRISFGPVDVEGKYCNFFTYRYSESKKRYVYDGIQTYPCPKEPFDF